MSGACPAALRTLVFATLLLLPLGCSENEEGDANGGNGRPTQPRSFSLAAAPFQFSVSPSNIQSTFVMDGFAGRVDLISLHMDNFFGLPWDEFASGEPLPDPWLEAMEQIRNDADQLGVGVYLSLTPISATRVQIAAKAVDQDGELLVDEDWAPGCYNFAGGPGHEDIRTGFLNYVRWMVDYFEPVYLTHGIEMNMYDIACPDDYASLIGLLNEAYDQEKGLDPDLAVFPTLTVNDMWYHPEAQGCFPNDRACMRENLVKIAGLKRDRLGISSYPIWLFQELDSWPEDHFTAFSEETGEQVVFGETGWNNHPVTVPVPYPNGPCQTITQSSDSLHVQYMEYLFEKADQMGSDLVVWWSLRDYLFDPILTSCPCSAPDPWCVLYDALEEIGLLPAWLMWGSMGVLDYDGQPKAALTTWNQWRSRPIRVPSN